MVNIYTNRKVYGSLSDLSKQKARVLSEAEKNVNAWNRFAEKSSKIGKSFSFNDKKFNSISESEKGTLSQLLKNQIQYINVIKEAEGGVSFRSSFKGLSPESLLKVVLLTGTNSVADKIFTKIALKGSNDALYFLKPTYSNKSFRGGNDMNTLKGYYVNGQGVYDDAVAYESTDYKLSTNYFNGIVSITDNNKVKVEFKDSATVKTGFGENGESYISGYSKIILVENGVVKDSKSLAIQGSGDTWYSGKGVDVSVDMNVGTTANPKYEPLQIAIEILDTGISADGLTIEGTLKANGKWDASSSSFIKNNKKAFEDLDKATIDALATEGIAISVGAIGKADLEDDFIGNKLGKIDLKVEKIQFAPKLDPLAVSWSLQTQMTLDRGYNVNATNTFETVIAESMAKAQDIMYVSRAYNEACLNPACRDNEVEVDPMTSLSLDVRKNIEFKVGLAVDKVIANVYNKLKRFGSTILVCDIDTAMILKNTDGFEAAKVDGRAGGRYFGKFRGTEDVYVIPDDEDHKTLDKGTILCVCTNPNESYDTGMIIGQVDYEKLAFREEQRVNFHQNAEMGILEDVQIVNPLYFGRVKVSNSDKILKEALA